MARPRDEEPSDDDIRRLSQEYVICKACGFEYFDELDACPRCPGDEGSEGFPWWVVVAAAMALAGVILLFVL
jgi:hypothetical protein